MAAGEDFDNTILEYLVAEFRKDQGIDLSKDKLAVQVGVSGMLSVGYPVDQSLDWTARLGSCTFHFRLSSVPKETPPPPPFLLPTAPA